MADFGKLIERNLIFSIAVGTNNKWARKNCETSKRRSAKSRPLTKIRYFGKLNNCKWNKDAWPSWRQSAKNWQPTMIH